MTTRHNRGPGRPSKSAPKGRPSTLSIVASAELKNRLLEAAESNGRTLSQEAVRRLELSLEAEAALGQTMELTYGRQLGAMLILLGQVMGSVGRTNALLSTDHRDSRWLADAFAYAQVFAAVSRILDAYRPVGDPGLLASGEPVAGWQDNGIKYADLILGVLGDPDAQEQMPHADFVRDRLGSFPIDKDGSRQK